MDLATINPDAPYVVLGPWKEGSPNSYEQIAHRSGATYYDMGNAYNELKNGLPRDWDNDQKDDEMWRINQQFLDNQIAKHKSFVFTSDPSMLPNRSFGKREYQYILTTGTGYHLEHINGVWVMKA